MSQKKVVSTSPIQQYVRLDWIALFSMILVFATGYLIWTKNLQAIWLRGLFYTCIFMLFAAALIRMWWRNQMGPGRQLLFVIMGVVVGYGMMQEQVQSWLSQQTGLQMMPLGLVSNATGTVALNQSTIIIILIALLAFIIWKTPKGMEIF